MKLKTGIFILIALLNATLILGQNEIEYKPKALIKTLHKAGISDLVEVMELALHESDSISNINGKYFLIRESNINQYQYIYIGRVNSCRAGGCTIANNSIHDSNSEYFDYFIIFDKNKTIQTVKVFNYQASHGHEVTAKGWLKQFNGFDGSKPLKVEKNIDAISGATISVYAITSDIENKTEILKKIDLKKQ